MLKKSWIIALVLAVCIARALTEGDGSDISPYFASRPANYTKILGEDVTIECILDIEQVEDASLLWSVNQSGKAVLIVNNNKVIKSLRDRYSVIGDFSKGEYHLLIKTLTLDDEGVFICHLFEPPSTQQNYLVINVPATATLPPATPGFLAVDIGDPITLQCEGRGKPTPTVTWAKTGDNLPDGRPSFIGETLEISESSVDDAGEYFCVADNGVGRPATAFVEVLVQYPPSVTVGESVYFVKVERSSMVSLVCVFDGVPAVDVIWRHNGKEINIDDYSYLSETHVEGRHTLRLNGLMEQDLGIYECVGTSNMGETIGEMVIRAEPHDLVINSDSEGSYSDEYSLAWAVKSHNQLIEFDLRLLEVNESLNESEWKFNVIPAPEYHDYHHKQSYTIKELAADTEYSVELRARNEFGFSEWIKFSFITNEEGNTAPHIPPPTPAPVQTIKGEEISETDSYTVLSYGENRESGSGKVIYSSLLLVIITGMLFL